MKYFKALILILTLAFLTISCFEDDDDTPISTSDINDFVWKGMNTFYLYKENTPDLANNRFSSDNDYNSYLNSFSKPENLFESLIYQRQTVDRFSWIVDDYIALEQFFSGISTSNGMEYKTFRFSSTDTNIYGYVTYVLPNTDAAAKGVTRGDIFYGINGTQLTTTNYRSLLDQNNYIVNLGNYNDNNTPDNINDDSITESSQSVSLSKSQYTENPIFINNVLDVAGTKVAYLMYNGFTGTEQFNAELNDTFGVFKNANATELVLDLRYNPGGSVYTAIMLSSLITGQFNGDVFSTEQWNDELQQAFESEDPEALINRFINNNEGTPLNSLNLNKVYILTSRSSASASELVINSLDPYIDVVQIGTTTSGKYQASTTLYDSPNFRRNGANPSHTYAMQPLIFKSLNIDGVTDYFDGLSPETGNVLPEDINNLGVLGNISEPLLAAAIAKITGTGRSINKKTRSVDFLEDSKDLLPFAKNMYTDKKLPAGL
ncbi:S41 family peptidase [Flavivirga rizhaonensis]|uniref:Carboxyl-terminal protease n=1 Tax=Flavivirga rizhaonensis TaxID=2559571 RepID=A0A4V3P4U3_9FLAO|nr:S41 family peptidase [Flavivirga rizhaonensis]TGV02734.1 carboxyl-terminal protease [Flavivirga rizhaonensis]